MYEELHSTYPQYLWFPDALINVTESAERLGRNYFEFLSANPAGDREKYLWPIVKDHLGVKDVTPEEIKLLANEPAIAPYTFADIISRRAQTGWSTHGHSGADVNIYSSDREAAQALTGNHENTEVGDFLRNYLDVDVAAITKELNEKGVLFDKTDASGNKASWMGKKPEDGERLDGQDHLDHYQGDFKKHRRCDICGM